MKTYVLLPYANNLLWTLLSYFKPARFEMNTLDDLKWTGLLSAWKSLDKKLPKHSPL